MSSCASSLDDVLLFEDKINGIPVPTKSLSRTENPERAAAMKVSHRFLLVEQPVSNVVFVSISFYKKSRYNDNHFSF